MSDLSATTKVTVELTGRRPTIADVRAALDVLTTEGIPDTFEVDIVQREDREYIDGVPHSERPVTLTFRVEAERASKSGGDPMTERTNEAAVESLFDNFGGYYSVITQGVEVARFAPSGFWSNYAATMPDHVTYEWVDRRTTSPNPEPPTGDGGREGVGRRG